jgi:hypothetical protein
MENVKESSLPPSSSKNHDYAAHLTDPVVRKKASPVG